MALIIKKEEFVNRVKAMKEPILSEFSDDDYENLCFIVRDKQNFIDRFSTGYVRWWRDRRNKEDLRDYYIRARKFRKKIERWFNEALAV